MWEKITANWWTEVIFAVLLVGYVAYKIYTGVDIDTAINSALGVVAYLLTTWGVPGTRAHGMWSSKEVDKLLQKR